MISTKGRYALRVMIDLAEHNNGQPVPLLNSISFPEFHPAAAELTPETTEVKLEFTGARDNLILIRNIRLYQ